MSVSQEEIQSLRKNYQLGALSEHDCAPNPVDQFQHWFAEVLKSACDEPNAFTLGTVKDGKPRGRIVLFKGYHLEGPVFYTNYESPKGQELADFAHASATFVWLPLQRQVRIEGRIERVPAEASDQYFATRPYGSQIGAIASPQGEVVESREYLEKLYQEARLKYPEGSVVPRPKNWGGFALVPERWEFWQGRQNRLHDRVVYVKHGAEWTRQRLAP